MCDDASVTIRAARWLLSLSLERYEAAFRENEIYDARGLGTPAANAPSIFNAIRRKV